MHRLLIICCKISMVTVTGFPQHWLCQKCIVCCPAGMCDVANTRRCLACFQEIFSSFLKTIEQDIPELGTAELQLMQTAVKRFIDNRPSEPWPAPCYFALEIRYSTRSLYYTHSRHSTIDTLTLWHILPSLHYWHTHIMAYTPVTPLLTHSHYGIYSRHSTLDTLTLLHTLPSYYSLHARCTHSIIFSVFSTSQSLGTPV